MSNEENGQSGVDHRESGSGPTDWTCRQFSMYTVGDETAGELLRRVSVQLDKLGDIDVLNVVVSWCWTRNTEDNQLQHEGKASVYFVSRKVSD